MHLTQKLDETNRVSTTLIISILVETFYPAEGIHKFICPADRILFSSQE